MMESNRLAGEPVQCCPDVRCCRGRAWGWGLSCPVRPCHFSLCGSTLCGATPLGRAADPGQNQQVLKSQLTDGFENGIDPQVWHAASFSRGEFRGGDNCAIIDSATPGPAMNYGGFTTRKRHFHPQLQGTNVLEATWTDYKSEGELVKSWVSPVYGPYSYGWTLTIGNYQGWTGEGINTAGKKRSVHLILDVWGRELGLDAILVHDVVPRDLQDGPDKLPETHRDKEHAIDAPKPSLTKPCALLSARNYPRSKGGLHDQPWGHRYGLYLRSGGRRLWWTLDGQIMDSVDIPAHYFSEAETAESLREGAYATIMAAAFYKRGIYKVDDVKISVSV